MQHHTKIASTQIVEHFIICPGTGPTLDLDCSHDKQLQTCRKPQTETNMFHTINYEECCLLLHLTNTSLKALAENSS